MDAHDTVVDFALVAVILPSSSHGLLAAFANAGLVHTADGVLVRVIGGHDPLAAVPQLFFIPLDRFQEALQRPRSGSKSQSNRLGRLAMHIR